MPRLIFHYDTLYPYLRSAKTHEREKSLRLLDAAGEVVSLTIWTPPDVLRRQLEEGEIRPKTRFGFFLGNRRYPKIQDGLPPPRADLPLLRGVVRLAAAPPRPTLPGDGGGRLEAAPGGRVARAPRGRRRARELAARMWFRCLFRGENFPGQLAGVAGLVGFFVTRFVRGGQRRRSGGPRRGGAPDGAQARQARGIRAFGNRLRLPGGDRRDPRETGFRRRLRASRGSRWRSTSARSPTRARAGAPRRRRAAPRARAPARSRSSFASVAGPARAVAQRERRVAQPFERARGGDLARARVRQEVRRVAARRELRLLDRLDRDPLAPAELALPAVRARRLRRLLDQRVQAALARRHREVAGARAGPQLHTEPCRELAAQALDRGFGLAEEGLVAHGEHPLGPARAQRVDPIEVGGPEPRAVQRDRRGPSGWPGS